MQISIKTHIVAVVVAALCGFCVRCKANAKKIKKMQLKPKPNQAKPATTTAAYIHTHKHTH